MLRPVLVLLLITLVGYGVLVIAVALLQRRMLYFPSRSGERSLGAPADWQPWTIRGEYWGFQRVGPAPTGIWLMLHGNGGEAAGRAYVLPRLAPTDALYVVEYPGYGGRPGSPSLKSINAVAVAAYQQLVTLYPGRPIQILGESLGSGPASVLAAERPVPARIVLVVPFDTLASVAAEQMAFLPAAWLLFDRWDNLTALQNYTGPLEIYGESDDRVVPIAHAEKLAKGCPQAQFRRLLGGHNDWSQDASVNFSEGLR